MLMMLEEIVKLEKDKDLEEKYKKVRQSLRLYIARYVAEYSNGVLEKYIASFVKKEEIDEEEQTANVSVVDLNNPNVFVHKHVAATKKQKSSEQVILEELERVGNAMDKVFLDFDKLEGGMLATRISKEGIINMGAFAELLMDSKMKCFPRYIERFSYSVSEEQEIKAVIPRSTFKTIKLIIDKYYFMFRLISINPSTRDVFQKISTFREKLHNFEYLLFNYIRKLRSGEQDFSKIIGNYTRELKFLLLHYKKFFEAMNESQFGKLVNTLLDTSQEAGMRMFIKHNDSITVVSAVTRTEVVMKILLVLENFDGAMNPMQEILAPLDFSKRKQVNDVDGELERQRAFWKVSILMPSFKEKMNIVINEFLKIVPQSHDDFKYLLHSVQALILPYMNQQNGEINESFTAGLKNINTLFWKLTMKIIEHSLPKGFLLSDLLGFQVRVSEEDIAFYKEKAIQARKKATSAARRR